MVHHGPVTGLWPHLGGGALARGDKVVAAARSVKSLSDLAEEYGDAVLPLALDVTKREKVEAVIPKAHARFGRLDVVINNAGYASLGAVEEATEAGVRGIRNELLWRARGDPDGAAAAAHARRRAYPGRIQRRGGLRRSGHELLQRLQMGLRSAA